MFAKQTLSVNGSKDDPSGCQIEVLKGLSSFLGLRAEWDALYENAATPQNVFQSHSFLRHWAGQYVGEAERLYFVCGRIEDQLAMVWPLLVTRRLGVDVMTIMGAPAAQFFDILVSDVEGKASLLNAGWNAICALQADVFIAHNVRRDASIHFCNALRSVELPGKTTAPYADLRFRVKGDEPGRAYTPRARSNYRRRLRRAGEYGEISFSSLKPGAQAAELAAKAISFKQSALLKKRIWSPTVSDPRFGRFFEDLAADPDSSLRVSAITCGGKEIGIELSFDCNGHTFGHVLAIDPDAPIDGLGSLLIIRAFMSAAARGTHTFEMMLPADVFKLQHADGEIPVASLAVAFTRKGKLYQDVYLRRVHPIARSVARQFAAPMIARILRGLRRREQISP